MVVSCFVLGEKVHFSIVSKILLEFLSLLSSPAVRASQASLSASLYQLHYQSYLIHNSFLFKLLFIYIFQCENEMIFFQLFFSHENLFLFSKDLVVGDENAGTAAWRLLEYLLLKYEAEGLTKLHQVVSRKIMSHSAFLPHWLEASYKVACCIKSEITLNNFLMQFMYVICLRNISVQNFVYRCLFLSFTINKKKNCRAD